MIYLSWTMYFLNVMLVMIMMLNFLIAVVSNSFARVESNQQYYRSRNINQLNLKYYRVKAFFKEEDQKFNSMVIFNELKEAQISQTETFTS